MNFEKEAQRQKPEGERNLIATNVMKSPYN